MAGPIPADGTPRILVDLVGRPTAEVSCIFECSDQPATAIWYMPLGCVALHPGSFMQVYTPGIRTSHRVQPLCGYHSERREPLQQNDFGQPPVDAATAATVPGRFLHGEHLLVDFTVGEDTDFPARPWAECGPHWSDTANHGAPLPPALELGYDLAQLQRFAATDLGRVVFFGHEALLAGAPGGVPQPGPAG